MRLLLAREFGGGPAYWLGEASEDVVSTAMDIVLEDQQRRDRRV